ncbi:MAG: C4-dicarboxylate ABC transporter permease [gamma proteobacterium symbiont of Stewartia floridana]|nr:TRAP transporter small permease subunit [Candidatus Thiodiazotropha taylori]MCG7963227.1 TRAP transporter small permease subunit [Candidatus Thiodiazotropha endolucinida]RLW52647.1 MAG: C4-dicarboxylate ABC transporter permease [gamma proteobacterium symbiont of Stewartia floridana]MCG7907667.1 TRAP transporter small permease subunit [Candidatus Thiodiazotropha taylori]MCG7911745.1 TRAP transporter small permease subunit [Candidatus Thiodiazotropha taylori]
MSHFLATIEKIARGFDQINERLGQAISWLSLLMVLVTVAVVVLRYVFQLGWIWLQESVTFMHAALFLVGAAYTLKHEGHVRVDIIYRKFSERGRAWVDLIGTLTLLLPVCLFIFFISWDYVAKSWALFEGSREVGGLEGVFLLKSLILVMAVLLVLQGISLAVRSLSQLLGQGEVSAEGDG